MKIDRHNYEEYFLLYIDSELTAEQKKQVDLFVRENPDLEEELVMLQQSKLIPDNSIVFDKKDLLIKNENNSFINLNNYEEWLVLYVDDELNKEEKIAVEKFAATHSHIKQELTLFQQTKLHSEKIVFSDKEVLYKKESVRVISMQWWRVAAAAVLIIAAGITLYSILNNRNNNGGIKEGFVKRETKKEQAPNSVRSTTNKQDENTINDKEDREKMAVITPTNKEIGKEKKQQEQPKQENNQQLAYNIPSDVIESHQRVTSEINDTKIEQSRISNAVVVGDKLHKDFFNDGTVTNTNLQTPDKNNTSDDVEYASNTENKKFRGFFRKATRLIERTTSINPADDDNRVLIGGMAINLK